MISTFFTTTIVAILGAATSAFLATLPVGSALHVCGLLMLILTNMSFASILSPAATMSLTIAVAVGYTFGSFIPALVFQCTDETSLYLPPLNNRVSADGQLHQAVMYTGVGAIGAIFILLLLAPFADFIVAHLHWLYQNWRDPLLSAALLCLIVSLIHDSWRSSHTGRGNELSRLFSGLLTLFLSGAAGLVLFIKPLGGANVADMRFTPLVLGLWVIPWLVKNINNRPTALQRQASTKELTFDIKRTIFAIISGSIMGLIGLVAAFVGPCTMAIAGWVLLRRERRIQLIGQAAARTVFIVGGVLLVFLPKHQLFRGHFNWFFQGSQTGFFIGDFIAAISAMLIAAACSFALLSPMATMAIKYARTFPRYLIPAISGGLIIISVLVFFGFEGLLVLGVGSAIGGFCLAYGGRRTSCLGAFLIPALCNLLGFTDYIANFLSL